MTTTQAPSEKRQRFARIAPSRVDKIRDMLRVLGNCSNKANYSYDQPKVRLLFGLLMREFITTARCFDVHITAQVDDIDVKTL